MFDLNCRFPGSTALFPLNDIMWAQGFNYYPSVDDSQVYISSFNHSFNSKLTIVNYCLGISTWIYMLCLVIQSHLTLYDPMDCSPPGSLVPGILQARALEWVAISFSNVWKWKVKVKSLSRVRLLATPWTAAYQAPLSMGFSRQVYWSGVPLPSPLSF